MNTKPLIAAGLFIGLLASSIASRAYDIDIYSAPGGAANTPNIMVVIDNPSDQNSNMPLCTYYDGSVPSNPNKSLGADQCALVNLVHNLATKPDGTAQVALGLTTMSGVDFPLTPVDDNTYTGATTVTISNNPVTIPAGTSNRNAIILAVQALAPTNGKSGQGAMMAETWSYYTGGNNGSSTINTAVGLLSGRVYPAPGFPPTAATTGCQKNYIIYLSSVKAGASHAATWTQTPAPYASYTEDGLLHAAATNATLGGAYGKPLSTTNPLYLKLDPSATGYTGLIPYPTQEAPYALEWARFMFNTDVNPNSTGLQGIITYSIATGATAAPGTPITSNMEQYIEDMAIYGGGKYYAAGGDPAALQNDILKILNEVQAVNSVFSSSSLPVSVNAQGTFLNQIYMGMFRPDPAGNPRWYGNLKQYQFALNPNTNTLFLADSLSNSAISAAGTGFISSNAISFWTCTDLTTSPYPNPYLTASPANLTSQQIQQLSLDLQGCADQLPKGFWGNDPSSVNAAALGFDLPDGERVERGGSAQQIRSANLTANYSTTPETSTNPRRLYTWCPSGAGCVSALENPSPNPNAFDTSNASITDALLGTGPRTITSITHATTVNPNSPLPGAWASPFGNNSANPTITITALSKTASTLTATVTAADMANTLLHVGAQVMIASGAAKFDCAPCIVTGINTTNNTFTYTGPSGNNGTPTLPTMGQIYVNFVLFYSPTPHGLSGGQLITISGCTNYTGLNGLVGSVSAQPGWMGSTWFVVSVPTPQTYNPTNPNDYTCQYTPNTATVTTSLPHLFSPGEVVTIAGTTGTTTAPYTGFNGNWSITPTGAYTFTYQYTAPAPLANWSSAGGTATSGTITRDALTKWMRGDDNMGDEYSLCPPGTTAGTGNCPVSGATTIRPSVHGDVLHSRPTVLNYGFHTVAITGTSDSGGVRTATASASDVGIIKASGAVPVITFANGDACAVTVTSSTTFTYPISIATPPATCGAAGAQNVAVGSKVVVYYGDNGGVFHAINGNRSETLGLAGPGDEIWGFVPREFFPKLARLMANSPIVQMPTTPTGITPAPQPKDWFVDGAPGVYQVIDPSGNTVKAVIYLAMRRGTDANGRGFIYALDVTNPVAPAVLWKRDSTSPNMGELGQTWSQPKVAFVNGYCNAAACSSSNPPSPVLIFGAGYDTNEDSEPITAMDTQGRGIFVLDALTGAVVWSASPTGVSGCGGAAAPPCHTQKTNMLYSIPSDITLVDRDSDGLVDRLYAADMGGNIWRVDLEPPKINGLGVTCGTTPVAPSISASTNACTPDVWSIYQMAALGGATGPCYGATPGVCNPTQRKFFYPPEVITATSNNNYDAVIAGSGDREHPLYVSTSSQRNNRIFLLEDVPGNDASLAPNYPITLNTLDDCTGGTCLLPSTVATNKQWCKLVPADQNNGYYITLNPGEKVVNAPLVVAGMAYMSTNQPNPPSTTSCLANLGVATGYQLSPFCGTYYTQVFAGGGLPPSPVAGVVDVVVNGVVRQVPFLIGGANPNCTGSDCTSALGAQKPPITVPTTRHRTYRYIKGK